MFKKRLEREVLEISDRERRAIGQDLHDSLGQLLAGIGFKSKSLENKISARGGNEAKTASDIARLVTDAISQARSLARGLQPVEPNPLGLMSAMTELAARVQELFKVDCVFVAQEAVTLTDPAAASHLYRIAQEACNNAVKHGRAKKIEIELSKAAERCTLVIRNDGIAFDSANLKSKGMGLRIMQYRAGMIGGTLVIRPNENGGAVVQCEFSCDP